MPQHDSAPTPESAAPTTPGGGLRRRRLMTGAAALTLGSTAAGIPVRASATGSRRRDAQPRGGTFRWLGTAGWQVRTPEHELLVDPYLSRYPTGLAAGAFDPRTPLRTDAGAIERAVDQPSTILVTHTHWDHMNDVPYLARRHGARVVGTMTTYCTALAMDVPERQLLPVKGGEVLVLDDLVVRVVSSLHSRTGTGSLLFPGTRGTVPPTPQVISDLPEGDTLSFVVNRPGGPHVYVSGASDVDEQALSGVEADVAIFAVPSNDSTWQYVPRLLEALGRPRVVIPVHWDDFESPPTNPPTASESSRQRLDATVREVRRVSPRSRVIVPDYTSELALL